MSGSPILSNPLHLGFEDAEEATITSSPGKDMEEILNLQPKGVAAKPYQVKQVRNVILKYKLGVNENE